MVSLSPKNTLGIAVIKWIFLANKKEYEFSLKMSPQSMAYFGYWQNAGVTTKVSILLRIRTQLTKVKG